MTLSPLISHPKDPRRYFSSLAFGLCLLATPATAATLTFTITASEPVTVTGTPRIAIDVGGVMRYALFSGNGSTPSASLPFSYAVQAGDFDADGIDVTPQLDLDGATLADEAGNALTTLAFAKPDTTALKVQTYTASFTSTADPTAVSFAIAKAPVGASFSYSIASSGGSASVTGTGTIGSSSQIISGIDVSALPLGTLTLSVTISNASGTGVAKTASFTPSYTGILDSLPTAAAAYSVRRLRAAYTGPAVRLRRSTDNAQQDIGYTVGGDLDQAALGSFCGTASCFVRTWYDQTANGWDAVITNAGVQPRLVNAGTMELFGSKPGVRFFGSQRMDALGLPSTADEFTISLVAVERARTGGITWLLSTAPNVLAHMPWSDGILHFDIGTRISAAWPLAVDSGAVASFRNSASAGTRSVYLNGSVLVTGAGAAAATSRFSLGGSSYNAAMAEALLFTSSISDTARQTLERSQGSYFGVTVQ